VGTAWENPARLASGKGTPLIQRAGTLAELQTEFHFCRSRELHAVAVTCFFFFFVGTFVEN
jgi:hypothetical protein